MLTKLLVATAVPVLAVSLSACGGADDAADDGPLRVGTEGTYAPFTYHDPQDNELTGYDVDVITAVADEMGRDVDFSEATFDSIFAGLEADRYDVIANQISVTPERAGQYDFSAPYTESRGVVVTRADDDSITSLDDVAGKTSAQSVTSNWAQTAEDLGADVEAVEGFTQAVALLKQGRVDILINDNLAVLDYLQTSGDTDIKIAVETEDSTQQAFALRQGSELTPEIDEALTSLRADGTLADISQKWFGEDVTGDGELEAPAAG